MKTSKFAPLFLTAGAVLSGLLAAFFGAVPLTGVEPKGLFVQCGPAVFGRPSPIPAPECAAAYNVLPFPLVALTWFLMIAGVVMVLCAAAIVLNRRKVSRPAAASASHTEPAGR